MAEQPCARAKAQPKGTHGRQTISEAAVLRVIRTPISNWRTVRVGARPDAATDAERTRLEAARDNDESAILLGVRREVAAAALAKINADLAALDSSGRTTYGLNLAPS